MSELAQTAERRRKALDLSTQALNRFAQFLDDYSVEDNRDAQKLADEYLDQLRYDLDDITGRSATA